MTLRPMILSELDDLEDARDAVRAFHMSEAEFGVFYDRTARPLWAYVYRLTRDPARSDDILQEAYYRFLRTPNPPAEEAHRRNYLYRVATNLVRDDLRRRREQHVDLGADDDAKRLQTDDAADTVAARADIGRALTHLTARERELLWLAYAEGASHREIAEVLGLKTGSIKQLLFRARRRLADVLRRPARASAPAPAPHVEGTDGKEEA